MKYRLIALLLLVTAPVLAQQVSVPEIPYQSVPNLLKLPSDVYLGEVAGVAVNSKADIFVYTRSGHTELLEFDPRGNFVRRIGKGLYGFVFAHSVKVDGYGNIWCVDEGSNMVIKFSPKGQVLMVLGRRPEPSEHLLPGQTFPSWMFNRPTDVAWDEAGDIFVSDGYGNSRVVKYDRSGDWMKAWGKRGAAPGEFNTPHSIAVDARGRVYVADRGNRRIQVFDSNGKFLKQWTGIGAPWAICITPAPNQVIYSSDSVPGRIYKLNLDGRKLGVFGKAGKRLGEFGWVHEMACPSENVLYVGELLNWRVQKLILHPAN